MPHTTGTTNKLVAVGLDFQTRDCGKWRPWKRHCPKSLVSNFGQRAGAGRERYIPYAAEIDAASFNRVTDYSRVFIKDCVGHDLYFLDTNRHSIRDSVVLSSAWRALAIIGRETTDPATVPRACSVDLDNVLIRREQGLSEIRVTKNSSLTARRVTLLGLHLQPTGGTVSLHHSVLAGTPASQVTIWKDVTWQADNNFYDIEFLRLDKTFYSAKTFADFRLASGQDAASRYEPVPIQAGLPTVPGGVGAEPGMVAELIHTKRKDPGRSSATEVR